MKFLGVPTPGRGEQGDCCRFLILATCYTVMVSHFNHNQTLLNMVSRVWEKFDCITAVHMS